MALYYAPEDETRAATGVVAAAIDRLVGWVLCGPRQHDSDLLLSLGRVSSVKAGERTGKRS